MLPANSGVCQIPLLTTLEIEWGMALSIACVAYVLGQHISDFDPQFASSIRTISVVVEKHATIISVALRNAQLAHRGSIRRAHCALTWVGTLLTLQTEFNSQDASQTIKQYNTMASAGAQLQGNKRVSILALLQVDPATIGCMMDALSTLTSDGTPWTDEAWSNKKVMPGHVARSADPAWSARLTITTESFGLMVRWQAAEWSRKLPMMRRKLDKHHLEEGAQVAAFITSLKREVTSKYDIKDAAWDSAVTEPFLNGAEPNFVLALQGFLHSKPKLDLDDVPLLSDLIRAHVSATDMAVCGAPKSELINAQIEKTEFVLFIQKLQADEMLVDSYHRKSRTFTTTAFAKRREWAQRRVTAAKEICNNDLGQLWFNDCIDSDTNTLFCRFAEKWKTVNHTMTFVNMASPSLVRGNVQCIAIELTGGVTRMPNVDNGALLIAPVHSNQKGQLYRQVASCNERLANTGLNIDRSWNLLFDAPDDPRDERPINFPGHFLLPLEKN